MEIQYNEIGRRIQCRRKELHIKQSELAEILNISNNHMSSIEYGREKPSMDVFLQICKELQTTPDYLTLGAMHIDNVSQNIIDGLHLCSKEDVELVYNMTKLLIERNHNQWNHDHFI